MGHLADLLGDCLNQGRIVAKLLEARLEAESKAERVRVIERPRFGNSRLALRFGRRLVAEEPLDPAKMRVREHGGVGAIFEAMTAMPDGVVELQGAVQDLACFGKPPEVEQTQTVRAVRLERKVGVVDARNASHEFEAYVVGLVDVATHQVKRQQGTERADQQSLVSEPFGEFPCPHSGGLDPRGGLGLR